ncbi:putative membrane protein [Friedmanniella endophytica]|uniref:Putative membrane protein n=1 Tax=Microlunatus kandeliicorticis TaxID=1759536 RepID=A0A7W3IVD6_9ACTN|nr:TMEM175 family protein [Microlunatus kandeliicorticis]MBA8795963.1 putative membrane protein [Microlunatus kandeliicorticis]
MTSEATPGRATDSVAEDERERIEADVEFAAAERLTFFSDAVVAIALTLLALELPVPEGDSIREVLRGLQDGIGEYIAFAISFAVISGHWRNHHRVFRYVARVDRRFIQLNLLWLFLVVITPWSTRLLSDGEINILRFGQYAAIQTVEFSLLAIMINVLIRSDMLRPGTDPARLEESLHRVVPVAVGFGLSIACYPLLVLLGLSPYLSYALWGVLPTVVGFAGRALRRQPTAQLPDGPTRPPKRYRGNR